MNAVQTDFRDMTNSIENRPQKIKKKGKITQAGVYLLSTCYPNQAWHDNTALGALGVPLVDGLKLLLCGWWIIKRFCGGTLCGSHPAGIQAWGKAFGDPANPMLQAAERFFSLESQP